MNQNTLTLNKIAEDPSLYSYKLTLRDGEELTLRPLLINDVQGLTKFLEKLSDETRRLSTFESYDEKTAKELCDAINKYDKLRFVVTPNSGEIVGLIELSLDLPGDDLKRFKTYNNDFKSEDSCRFGPTLADDYQSKGLGSLVFPYIIEIVKKFGKKSIILYGGVLTDNIRAIKFYEKFGFIKMGKYSNSDDKKVFDMILYL